MPEFLELLESARNIIPAHSLQLGMHVTVVKDSEWCPLKPNGGLPLTVKFIEWPFVVFSHRVEPNPQIPPAILERLKAKAKQHRIVFNVTGCEFQVMSDEYVQQALGDDWQIGDGGDESDFEIQIPLE